MAVDKTSHQPASFVIRLWIEPSEAPAGSEWRWRVVHVQSGAERYGERWAQLLAFISARAGGEPESPLDA